MASGGALDWLTASDTLEKRSAETRCRDSTVSLLNQYKDLLRCAQVHDEVEQQVGELRSAVQAAGMVQSADTLLQLEDELRRRSVMADHAQVAVEVAAVADAHRSAAETGNARLRAVAAEMQQALHELERCYYGEKK
jgi:hypothetical protein